MHTHTETLTAVVVYRSAHAYSPAVLDAAAGAEFTAAILLSPALRCSFCLFPALSLLSLLFYLTSHSSLQRHPHPTRKRLCQTTHSLLWVCLSSSLIPIPLRSVLLLLCWLHLTLGDERGGGGGGGCCLLSHEFQTKMIHVVCK